MPCLLTLLLAISPRLGIIGLALLTGWFRGVYDLTLWPILGFLFMPWTLLGYSVVVRLWDGQWTEMAFVVMLFAVLADLVGLGSSSVGA